MLIRLFFIKLGMRGVAAAAIVDMIRENDFPIFRTFLKIKKIRG